MFIFSLCGVCGCISDEGQFTAGRLENPCNSAIPNCGVMAGCVLRDDEFFRGTFPGGVRMVVRSELGEGSLILRILLTNPMAPGTEIHAQLHSPDCGNVDSIHIKDVDLFHLAGKDRTLEFHLQINGRGDHLLEVFSDMAADYLLGTVLKE